MCSSDLAHFLQQSTHKGRLPHELEERSRLVHRLRLAGIGGSGGSEDRLVYQLDSGELLKIFCQLLLSQVDSSGALVGNAKNSGETMPKVLGGGITVERLFQRIQAGRQ